LTKDDFKGLYQSANLYLGQALTYTYGFSNI